MNIVPLTEFPRLRRKYESKTQLSWSRDAREGKIPGAFRYTPKGDWFVDLDIHDEEVRKMAVRQPKKPLKQPDYIGDLAEKLGLSSDDIALAMEAAGV